MVFRSCPVNPDVIPLMQNPWRQLPVKAPFVLPMDAAAVAAYQQHFAGSPNLQLQTQLMPEPYHGNPNASICILSLNPGFSERDTHWHFDTELGASLRANLAHESAEYPFVYFDPRFEDSPGAKWWRRKTRRVIEHVGLSKAASAIFNVELFPYHSKSYRRVPKRLVANRLVPSSEYSGHLVREFIRKNKTIVVFRSFRLWVDLVPELDAYDNTFVVKNPRNPTISHNNLERFQELLDRVAV